MWLRFVVHVSGCGFWLHPAKRGLGLWCACLGTGFGLNPPILAGVWVVSVWVHFLASPCQSWRDCWVCVLLCAFCLYPANHGCSLWCVCSGADLGFPPPVLGAVWGVCVRVRVLYVPRLTSLGSSARVVGYGFRLRPANRGWGVGMCVFLCGFCLHPAGRVG